jgi:hypothetical protein
MSRTPKGSKYFGFIAEFTDTLTREGEAEKQEFEAQGEGATTGYGAQRSLGADSGRV